MKIEYDAEADALYIALRRAKSADTIDIEEGVTLDLDARRQVIGVEILDASRRFAAASLRDRARRHRSRGGIRQAARRLTRRR